MSLFVVATPIGNLSDLTERARQVLCDVPIIFAEDTRVTSKILNHIGSKAKLISYHQHTSPHKIDSLLSHFETGDVALVTDAGTPGVSDPGGQLIEAVANKFGESFTITPIPGASAVTAAASIAGFPMDEFVFLAYPPHKKGRKTFFDKVANIESSVIFFESVHRINKTMSELVERCPQRKLVLCRELTKKFETIKRGTVLEQYSNIDNIEQKGEFVLVLAPHKLTK
jgi:16S rRNA (cytidine1402-2'-O)-methyltransferase